MPTMFALSLVLGRKAHTGDSIEFLLSLKAYRGTSTGLEFDFKLHLTHNGLKLGFVLFCVFKWCFIINFVLELKEAKIQRCNDFSTKNESLQCQSNYARADSPVRIQFGQQSSAYPILFRQPRRRCGHLVLSFRLNVGGQLVVHLDLIVFTVEMGARLHHVVLPVVLGEPEYLAQLVFFLL